MNNLPEEYICFVVGISNYFGSDAYVILSSTIYQTFYPNDASIVTSDCTMPLWRLCATL